MLTRTNTGRREYDKQQGEELEESEEEEGEGDEEDDANQKEYNERKGRNKRITSNQSRPAEGRAHKEAERAVHGTAAQQARKGRLRPAYIEREAVDSDRGRRSATPTLTKRTKSTADRERPKGKERRGTMAITEHNASAKFTTKKIDLILGEA